MNQIGKGRLRQRQRGAIIIVFCLSVLGMLAMIGMALDLMLVYNRKAELQALADGAALAAARQLNGSAAGVTSARDQAATIAGNFRYQYYNRQVTWSTNALKFSNSASTADGGWLDYATARAAPDGVLFVRIDTGDLPAPENPGDSVPGLVNTVFVRLLDSSLATVATTARAVAGRASTNVLPLAVCAMSPLPAEMRANGGAATRELVEYGFRRGVSYNLMKLNPGGVTAENFVIDPLSPPGTPGSAANTSADSVGPFVCSGSMPMASVMGGQITVKRPFPIADLLNHINSRMDKYDGNACTPAGAPPDSNIKSYGSPFWMNPRPLLPAAQSLVGIDKLWTRADPSPGDAANSNLSYGTLWAYAKAVKFSSYVSGAAEPAGGYTTFAATDWAQLYTPNPPPSTSYPGATPYSATSGTNYYAPPTHLPGTQNRRVLNVPLLACPVAAGGTVGATVRAVGRFFLMAPADADSVTGEFAGLASAASLAGGVELYR